MLKCKKCNGNVLLDLSKVYSIRGIPVISEGKISATSIVFSCESEAIKFSCNHCGEVSEDELKFMCRECGDYFDKEELNVSPYGSTICNNCVAKYDISTTSKFVVKLKMEDR